MTVGGPYSSNTGFARHVGHLFVIYKAIEIHVDSDWRAVIYGEMDGMHIERLIKTRDQSGMPVKLRMQLGTHV